LIDLPIAGERRQQIRLLNNRRIVRTSLSP
jgi:hypothetical protein